MPPNPGITPTIKPIITPAIKKSIDGPDTIVMNALSRYLSYLDYKIINWGVNSQFKIIIYFLLANQFLRYLCASFHCRSIFKSNL